MNDKIIHLALFNEQLHHAVMSKSTQQIKEIMRLDLTISIDIQYVYEQYTASLGNKAFIQRLL